MKLEITLVKSPAHFPEDQRATVRALGLHRMHETVVHEDTPAIRGMLTKIPHLLQVREQA
jgi:large subunit ribosomal protein L30